MENSERKQYIKKCGVCEKQVSWIRGSKPETCPHCNSIRWDKPQDEAKLFNLQRLYLENRDQKILGQMYQALIPYTTKIALKMLRGVQYDPDKLEQKVEDALTYFISYYLRNKDFYVTESFGFQLLKALQQQLYNKKQQLIDMRELSYDEPIKEGEDNTFKDKISEDVFSDYNKQAQSITDTTNKAFLLKETYTFIDKMYTTIASTRGIDEALLLLVLLHHFLRKRKADFFDDFYAQYGTELKKSFELEKLVFFEFLEDLCNG